MSAFNPKLSALSQLNHARDEVIRAERELVEVKQGLGLVGLQVGGLERALEAMSLTMERVHAARCTLWAAVADEMRGRTCA